MKHLFALLLVIAANVTHAASFEDIARIVSVQEKTNRVPQQRRICDGGNQRQSSSNQIGAGTLIGAVAGGLLGAQVGNGNGRTAAAAAGAVAGAFTGNSIENKGNASGDQNCYTANDFENRVVGYDVTYEYQGRTYTDFFQKPPSDVVRLRVNLMPTSTQ